MPETKCRHQGCQCSGSRVRSDGYCSDDCKNEKSAGNKCGCGHTDCK